MQREVVWLELKSVKMENNGSNMKNWSAIIDDQGKIIEGG